MSYRRNDAPPKPDDMMPRFSVYNGAEVTFSFPCYYYETDYPFIWHDHHLHDHRGWPSPENPGRACQMLPDHSLGVWHLDMAAATPIRLRSDAEGYTKAAVVFDDSVNVTSSASIRKSPDDHIIDVKFAPKLASFSNKPHEHLFNVYVKSEKEPVRTDMVMRGILVVLPGPASSGL